MAKLTDLSHCIKQHLCFCNTDLGFDYTEGSKDVANKDITPIMFLKKWAKNVDAARLVLDSLNGLADPEVTESLERKALIEAAEREDAENKKALAIKKHYRKGWHSLLVAFVLLWVGVILGMIFGQVLLHLLWGAIPTGLFFVIYAIVILATEPLNAKSEKTSFHSFRGEY